MSEKKKYSLVIADMQLNVIADADPEEVDMLVGILDRKMREITLKSRSCSKNEAALLCALDFCAERLAMSEQMTQLETVNEKYRTVFEGFKEKVAVLEASEAELKRENAILRSLLAGNPAAVAVETPAVTEEQTDALLSEATSSEGEHNEKAEEAPEEHTPVSPTEFLAQVADAQTKDDGQTEAEKPKAKSRSRVGSMFDLLSFNEV